MNMDYSTNKIVIFTVASNDYLTHLEKLLASVNINIESALFYVYLINVDVNKDSYLEALYPNIVIVHQFVEFNSLSSQRGYCANLRASIFPILMKKYDQPIMWIDADSMIVTSDNELLSYSKRYDLSADYTTNHGVLTYSKRRLKKHPKGPFGTPYYGVFSTGVMFTNNSPRAKQFFELYAKKVSEFPLSWYSDQEALFILLV